MNICMHTNNTSNNKYETLVNEECLISVTCLLEFLHLYQYDCLMQWNIPVTNKTIWKYFSFFSYCLAVKGNIIL